MGDYDFVVNLDNMLQQAKERKQDDGASGDYKRRWAIIYTDLEKVKAYLVQYLLGGGDE